ncbi:hypothetical protein [Xenorhabdus innexi]|uniref:Uncharacterized protein n=1 Tax=Xenorhabdus innexi TaxID=290109 RepID=A0A1N6MWP7_9GAMM|nr:hypothetical protein [Xenorhabdus innexi]PHM35956.1 hypothetical protein Xinn_02026 [Xenorhabdus innexi]SIP73256.1 hypothetical protein XIS1_1790062 [Xenorhabdus innexi]
MSQGARFVENSYLKEPTEEMHPKLKETLWFYIKGSLAHTRELLRLAPSNAACPRASDVRGWMEILDLNTVGIARLLGVQRTSVATNYLKPDLEKQVGMTAPRLLRAGLLTGYFKHHPDAPQYYAAMGLLDEMVKKGELDKIWYTIVNAKKHGAKPEVIDQLREAAIATMCPQYPMSLSDPGNVAGSDDKSAARKVRPTREVYRMEAADKRRLNKDYSRHVIVDEDFTGATLDGMYNETVFVNCIFNQTKLVGQFYDAEFYQCQGTQILLNGFFDRAQFYEARFDVIELKGSFTFSRLISSFFGNPDGIEAKPEQFEGAEGILSYIDVRLPEPRTIDGRETLSKWIQIFPAAKAWSRTTQPGTPMGDVLHDAYFSV